MTTMNFKNDTDYAIVVSSWIDKKSGLSEYIDKVIPPNTAEIVTSSVGEWILGSLFYNEEYREKWKTAGLQFASRLAKFRSEPCYGGDYTWNFIKDRFDLKYEDGVVTWSAKCV
jgi:hypothetical protein